MVYDLLYVRPNSNTWIILSTIQSRHVAQTIHSFRFFFHVLVWFVYLVWVLSFWKEKKLNVKGNGKYNDNDNDNDKDNDNGASIDHVVYASSPLHVGKRKDGGCFSCLSLSRSVFLESDMRRPILHFCLSWQLRPSFCIVHDYSMMTMHGALLYSLRFMFRECYAHKQNCIFFCSHFTKTTLHHFQWGSINNNNVSRTQPSVCSNIYMRGSFRQVHR